MLTNKTVSVIINLVAEKQKTLKEKEFQKISKKFKKSIDKQYRLCYYKSCTGENEIHQVQTTKSNEH